MVLSAWSESHPREVEAFARAFREDRLHHAYLLVSPRLKMSRSFAGSLAASILCTDRRASGDACGACASCKMFAAGSHPDAMTVEPNEKRVIPIDTIRALNARLGLKSSTGGRKVVILSEADRMNPAAQNALLKTLEEPGGRTTFLLTAARPRSLLITVRSRCQKMHLAQGNDAQAVRALESAGIDESAARLLAPLVGDEVERAAELVDSDALQIAELVDRVLRAPGKPDLALEAAKDLGADRPRADLALAIVEIRVRDALAARWSGGSSSVEIAPEKFPALVERIQRLRRLENRSLNRTLALEGLFLSL